MVAAADDQIMLAQRKQEDGSHQEWDEGDLLLVELAELVDPADGIVRLRFAVREVNNGGVTLARVAALAGQGWDRASVIPRKDAARRPGVASQKGRKRSAQSDPASGTGRAQKQRSPTMIKKSTQAASKYRLICVGCTDRYLITKNPSRNPKNSYKHNQ